MDCLFGPTPPFCCPTCGYEYRGPSRVPPRRKCGPRPAFAGERPAVPLLDRVRTALPPAVFDPVETPRRVALCEACRAGPPGSATCVPLGSACQRWQRYLERVGVGECWAWASPIGDTEGRGD